MTRRDIRDLDTKPREEAKDLNYDESSINIRTWLVIAGVVIFSYFMMALPAAMDKIVKSFISSKNQ